MDGKETLCGFPSKDYADNADFGTVFQVSVSFDYGSEGYQGYSASIIHTPARDSIFVSPNNRMSEQKKMFQTSFVINSDECHLLMIHWITYHIRSCCVGIECLDHLKNIVFA